MEVKNQLITDLKLKNKELKQKISDLELLLQKNNALIDNLPDLFILLDPNAKILLLNEAMAKSLGEKKEKLIGKNALDLFPPEVAKYRTEMANKLIKTKKPLTFEDERDGRWFRQRLFPVFDSEGNVIQIANMVEEITDQKKVKLSLDKKESELKELSKKYKIIAENMTDLVFQITLNGKFTYVNHVSERYGYKPEEMIGKNFINFVPKKELPRYFKQVKKMISGEKIDNFDSFVVHKKGRLIPAEFSGQMVKIGKKRYINGIMRNITKRKEAEDEIKEEKQRAEKYLNLARTMIVALDKNGNITLLNNKGYEILGYNKGSLLGKNWFKTCIPNKLADEVKDVFTKLMDGKVKPVEHYENPVQRRDGKLRLINWYNTLIQDETGRIIGTLSSGEDITERKKSEEQTKKSKEYLQNVIDSASEPIFTINKEGKIKTWNKTARTITGYTPSHVVRKHVKNLTLFDDPDKLKDYIDAVFKGEIAKLDELTINTSFGVKRMFSVSPSFMRDESDNVYEILFVCRDVTYEKERHGRFLFGQGYLVSDVSSDTTVDIFSGMLRSDHPGLYVGRMSEVELKNVFVDVSPLIVRLSREKETENIRNRFVCSDFEGLLPIVEGFISKKKRCVVLFDRIEYLIVNSSFESVIKNIYRLNDMIRKHNCLLLLRVSPFLLDKTQMAIIKEELQELPERKIDDVQLEETLFEILNYIKIENKRNALVSYSRIGKQFSISKVTTQRRIELLIEKELVYSKKQGRIKTLYITDKGKNMLIQRTVV